MYARTLRMLLAAPSNDVVLIWGSHGVDAPIAATTCDHSLQLFVDRHGMNFVACVDLEDENLARRIRGMRRGNYSQCSVNLSIEASEHDRHRGQPRVRVKQARIDRIAILNHNAAYHPFTGARSAGDIPTLSCGPISYEQVEFVTRIQSMKNRLQCAISASNTRCFDHAGRDRRGEA